jgi:hypothetical protein
VYEYNILSTVVYLVNISIQINLAKRVAGKLKNMHYDKYEWRYCSIKKNNPMFGRANPEQAENPFQIIKWFDILTKSKKYSSIRETAWVLAIDQSIIYKYFLNKQKTI